MGSLSKISVLKNILLKEYIFNTNSLLTCEMVEVI